ncbi:MAG: LacI family DNA-binding transcriptional regulator [Chloroflexales bacterium]|nr:LacI family DNA-binding transcriptional regulator [Chloroflexales bacterium]
MYNTAMRNRNDIHSRPRVTLAEVAKALGVAPATVSNAYNRPDQLSPALRERVLATAAQMGYQPNPVARSLRRGWMDALGVLYTDRLSFAFVDPAFVQFLTGAATVVEAAGLSLVLLPGAPRQARDPSIVSASVVDGFLVYSMADDDPLVQAAIDRRLPIVCVDGPRLESIPWVGIDDWAAAHTSARHLLDLGHHAIGIIALPLTIDRWAGPVDQARQARANYRMVQERLRGYRAALEAARIAWEATPIEECAENMEHEGAAAARRLLEAHPHLTALLAMSDRLALGALRAVQKRGIAVPHQLSIVGFDDIAAAERATPPLTTVQQPHIDKGVRAAEAFIAQLMGHTPAAAELLPTQFIIRGSTAQQPSG